MRLVTNEQMRAIDKDTIINLPIKSIDLMENAAIALYNYLKDVISKDKKIMIICGGGNNGGDGLALARLLNENNYNVNAYMSGNLNHLSEDCQINYNRLDKALLSDNLDSYDIYIDAIFGTGLNKDINGNYYEVIDQVNNIDAYKIAVDIPSGINGNSGKSYNIAFKADLTLTLASMKTGLCFNDARLLCGKIVVLDIGIKEETIRKLSDHYELIDKKLAKELLPERKIRSNKGTYGKVLCVGGSKRMSGAICLASSTALRCGCGMMCMAIPESIRNSCAGNVLESTYELLSESDGYISEHAVSEINIQPYSTYLFGCGIGRINDYKALLEKLLDTGKPIVIDADGLISFKDCPPEFASQSGGAHLKEFADLFEANI